MRRFVPALLIALAAAPLAAAELTTLSTNAIRGPLLALAEQFKTGSGDTVKIDFDTSTSIARRMAAGESADVLVSTTAAVAQAIKEGKAIADSRVYVGKMAIAAAIRPGARRPDLTNVETLKASILQADAILYSQGSSGVYILSMLRDLGIADQVKAKAVQLPTGADMLKRIAASSGNELGFTQLSEIKEHDGHGITLVGVLPAAVQSYTSFDAVVLSGARAPAAARAFVRSIAAPPARKLLTAAGWEF